MNMKKRENRDTRKECRYFIKSIFVRVSRLFELVYLNRGNDLKRSEAQIYYLPEGIIENYNVIINGKNFHHKPIDSNIK